MRTPKLAAITAVTSLIATLLPIPAALASDHEADALVQHHRTELAAGIAGAMTTLGDAWLADIEGLDTLPMVGDGLTSILAALRAPFDGIATDVRYTLEDALFEAADRGVDAVDVAQGALYLSLGDGTDGLVDLDPAVRTLLAPLAPQYGDGLGLLADGADSDTDVELDDLGVIVRDDPAGGLEVGFTIPLEYAPVAVSLPFQLGIDVPATALVPQLGLTNPYAGDSADLSTTVQIGPTWTTTLEVGVSELYGFFIPVATAPVLATGITGSAQHLDFQASIGSFSVVATDSVTEPSSLEISQSYKLETAVGAGPGRMAVGDALEVPSSTTNDAKLRLDVVPSGRISSPIPDGDRSRTLTLPEVDFELEVDAEVSPGSVELKEVRLDELHVNARATVQGIGTAFGQFTETVLAPVDLVADGIDLRLPGISDIAGERVSLGSMLPSEARSFFDEVKALSNVETLIRTAGAGLPERARLGCVRVFPEAGPDDQVRVGPVARCKDLVPFPDFTASVAGGGVQITALDPLNVIKLAVGRPADLAEASLPTLDAKGAGDFSIGAGGLNVSVDGSLDAKAGLSINYDSTGLEKIAPVLAAGGSPDVTALVDGMYIANDPTGPEVGIGAAFSGSASGGVKIAGVRFGTSASVDVKTSLDLELVDPNRDGQLRYDEVSAVTDGFRRPDDARCLVTLDSSQSGRVRVGGPGISISVPVSLDIKLEELFGFGSGCGDILDRATRGVQILASDVRVGGENWLRLNAGAYANARRFGDTDDSEGVAASARSVAGGVVVVVRGTERFYPGSYEGVLAVGDSGPDVFDVSGLTIPAILDGGPGLDLLIGGAGDDLINGGRGADDIRGGPGDDQLEGDEQGDTILGQTGDDVIDGGEGNDPRLDGGAGDDVIRGGDRNDTISGGIGDDELHGGGGQDVVDAGPGDDIVFGGAGNDTLHGHGGNDTISGGSDDDTITGGAGDDTLSGGDGNDVSIEGGDGNDLVAGGRGDDTLLVGGPGDDTVLGGAGDDILDGGDGDDTIDGGLDTDIAEGGAGLDQLLGGAGDDVLDGGDDADELRGGPGEDTLRGDGGDDLLDGGTDAGLLLDGGAGDDTIVGGPASDVVRGGDGDDVVTSLAGDDEVRGGAGDDTIDTGDGDDTVTDLAGADEITTGAGDDAVDAGPGDDLVETGPGTDDVTAGSGDDTVSTGDGPDVVRGGDGADTVETGDGDDHVSGGPGDDTIDTGDGNDTVDGGTGDDLIRGGPGDDRADRVSADRDRDGDVDERDVIPGARGLDGGDGDDEIHAGDGDDIVLGGDGDDVLHAGDGGDELTGGAGRDAMYGETGTDTLVGAFGDAWIDGGGQVGDALVVDGSTGPAGPSGVPAVSSGTPTAVPFGTVSNGVLDSVLGSTVYAGTDTLDVLIGAGRTVALDGPTVPTSLVLSGGVAEVLRSDHPVDVTRDPDAPAGRLDALRLFADDPSGVQATIDATTVAGVVGAEVTHSGIARLDVIGSGAGDVVDVLSAGTGALDVLLGRGDDSARLTLPGDLAGVTIRGGDGDDTVDAVMTGTPSALDTLDGTGFVDVEILRVDARGADLATRWSLRDRALGASGLGSTTVGEPLLPTLAGVDRVLFLGSSPGADTLDITSDVRDDQRVTIGGDTVDLEEGVDVLSAGGFVGSANARAAFAPGSAYLAGRTGGITAFDLTADPFGDSARRELSPWSLTSGDLDNPGPPARLTTWGPDVVALSGATTDTGADIGPEVTRLTATGTAVEADRLFDGDLFAADEDVSAAGPRYVLQAETVAIGTTAAPEVVRVFEPGATSRSPITPAATLEFGGVTSPSLVDPGIDVLDAPDHQPYVHVGDSDDAVSAIASSGRWVFVGDADDEGAASPSRGEVRTYTVDGPVEHQRPFSQRSVDRSAFFEFPLPQGQDVAGLPLTGIAFNSGVAPAYLHEFNRCPTCIARMRVTAWIGTDFNNPANYVQIADRNLNNRFEDPFGDSNVSQRRFLDEYRQAAYTRRLPVTGAAADRTNQRKLFLNFSYDSLSEVSSSVLQTYPTGFDVRDLVVTYGTGTCFAGDDRVHCADLPSEAAGGRVSGGVNERGTLYSGDPSFGRVLRTDGGVLAVGDDTGTVRTYTVRPDSTGWDLRGEVASGEPGALALDLQDGILALGNPSVGSSGRAMVQPIDAAGVPVGAPTTWDGSNADDALGASVSLDAARGLLIGAPGTDGVGGADVGAAFLAPRTTDGFGPLTSVPMDGVAAGSECGRSVAFPDSATGIDQPVLFIGCPGVEQVRRAVAQFPETDDVVAVDDGHVVALRPAFEALTLIDPDGPTVLGERRLPGLRTNGGRDLVAGGAGQVGVADGATVELFNVSGASIGPATGSPVGVDGPVAALELGSDVVWVATADGAVEAHSPVLDFAPVGPIPTGVGTPTVLTRSGGRLLLGGSDGIAVLALDGLGRPTLATTISGLRGLRDVTAVGFSDPFLYATTADDRLVVLEQVGAGFVVRQSIVNGGPNVGLAAPTGLGVDGADVLVASAGATIGTGGLVRYTGLVDPPAPRRTTVSFDEQIAAVDVTTGSGDDTAAVRDIGRPLRLDTAGGADSVSATFAAAAQSFRLVTGDGPDLVTARSLLDSTLTLATGAGDDLVTLPTTGAGSSTTIDLGTDDDLVEVFADDLAGSVDITPSTDPGDELRYRTGFAAPPLPTTTGSVLLGPDASLDYVGIETTSAVEAAYAEFRVDGTTSPTISEGQGVTLDATGSRVSVGATATYEYDLDGDGAFGDVTGRTATVSWAALRSFGIDDDGAYPVGLRLTVRDGTGAVEVAEQTRVLTVDDTPPTATLTHRVCDPTGLGRAATDLVAACPPVSGSTGPVEIDEGGTVVVELAIEDPGDDTVSGFVIDWGDGVEQTLRTLPPGGLVAHTYAPDDTDQDRSVTITLSSVTDEDDTHAIIGEQLDLTLLDVTPLGVTATGDTRVDEGTPYDLTVTTTGKDADALDLVVNWGDGTVETFPASRTTPLRHRFDGPATAAIQVALVGSVPAALGTTTPVAVVGEAPVVEVLGVDPVLSLDGLAVAAEGTYTLDLSVASDPGDDTVSRWTIDWGDGTTSTALGATPSATHDFDGPAEPTIRVTATDEDGDTSATISPRILNVAPTIDIVTVPATVDEGTTATLSVAASDVDDLTYTLREGTTVVARNRTGRFTVSSVDDGRRDLTVTVDDGDGRTVDVPTPLTVLDVAPTVTIEAEDTREGSVALATLTVTDPGDDTATTAVVDDGTGPRTVLLQDGGGALLVAATDGPAAPLLTVVEVTDEDDTHSSGAATAMTVQNVAPTTQVTSGTTAVAGQTFTLDIAPIIDPGDDTVDAVVVDWGDGTSTSAMTVGADGSASAAHVFDGAVGSVDATVTIVDEDGAHGLGVPITILRAPVLDDGITLTTTEDVTATFLVGDVASDPDGDLDVDSATVEAPALTTDRVGLPTVTGGVVTYLPVLDASGVETFELTVCDESDQCDTATVTVEVSPAPDAPLPFDDVVEVLESGSGTVAVLDNDIEPDAGTALTLTGVDAGTSDLSVAVEGDRVRVAPDGRFETLAVGERTDRAVTYTVADDDGASTGTLVVTIIGENDAPIGVDDAATVSRATAVELEVLNNDTDIDGDALRVLSVDDDRGVTSVGADGTLRFLPGRAFLDLAPGEQVTLAVEYVVGDPHGGTATAELALTVTAPTDPTAPVAEVGGTTLRFTTTEDEPLRFEPGDHVVDPNGGPITVPDFDARSTAGGSISRGSLIYSPPADFNGEDTFTFVATTATGGRATFDVVVDVTAAPDAPRLVVDDEFDDEVTVRWPKGGTPDPLVLVDPDGDEVTVAVVSGQIPDGLTLEPDGSFSGAGGTTQVLGIVIEACDGTGLCAQFRVWLDGSELPVTGTDPLPLVLFALALVAGGAQLLRRERVRSA